MTDANVRVSLDDGVAHVEVVGEIDIGNAGAVDDRLSAALDGVRAVIVDLSDVTFMDSQAVALLDRLSERLAADGRAIAVVAPGASIPRRVLEIVDLGLELFERPEEARSALRSAAGPDGEASDADA